jgi:hypothetical protein
MAEQEATLALPATTAAPALSRRLNEPGIARCRHSAKWREEGDGDTADWEQRLRQKKHVKSAQLALSCGGKRCHSEQQQPAEQPMLLLLMMMMMTMLMLLMMTMMMTMMLMRVQRRLQQRRPLPSCKSLVSLPLKHPKTKT